MYACKNKSFSDHDHGFAQQRKLSLYPMLLGTYYAGIYGQQALIKYLIKMCYVCGDQHSILLHTLHDTLIEQSLILMQ